MPVQAGDLTLLRTTPQTTQLYLLVQGPERWEQSWYGEEFAWYAQVNGVLTGEPVTEITVDNGGPNADLLDRMTILIGTYPGAWDRGIYAVRTDQTVGPGTVTLVIAPTSGMGHVEDDDYITVLDEIRLWARYPRVTEAAGVLAFFKDWDVTYASLGANAAARRQASMPPTPVMGPHIVRFVDPGETVSIDFDWRNSYTNAPGATLNAWDSWGERTSGAWNVATSTTTQVYQTDDISGRSGYRVRLEVGTDLQDPPDRFRRGIRYVFTLRRPGQRQTTDPVNAEPLVNFEMNNVSGSFASGDWRGSIRVYGSDASELIVFPGALTIIFADDTFGSTDREVGPFEGGENIVLIGRVVDGTIMKNDETGDVTFDIISATGLAKARDMYPVPIESRDTATEWYQTPTLTVWRAAWHYIAWHTNLSLICDVNRLPANDDQFIFAQDFLAGDMYSVIDRFLQDRRFARVLCDRYERIACRVDQQLQPQTSADTLFSLADTDWINEVSIRELESRSVNLVDAGGVSYAGGNIVPYLSLAPGFATGYEGKPQTKTSLAVTSQVDLNILSGRSYAYGNIRYPTVSLQMAGNWRIGDIWPQEYVRIGLETVRRIFSHDGTYGLYGAGDFFILREISYRYNADAGAFFVDYGLEEETDGPPGITVPIPEELPTPEAPAGPATYGVPPQTSLQRPVLVATDVGMYYTLNIYATSPTWFPLNTGLGTDLNCMDFVEDPFRTAHSRGLGRNRMYMVTTDAVFVGENMFAGGAWQTILTNAEVQSLTGTTFPRLTSVDCTSGLRDYVVVGGDESVTPAVLVVNTYVGPSSDVDDWMGRGIGGPNILVVSGLSACPLVTGAFEPRSVMIGDSRDGVDFTRDTGDTSGAWVRYDNGITRPYPFLFSGYNPNDHAFAVTGDDGAAYVLDMTGLIDPPFGVATNNIGDAAMVSPDKGETEGGSLIWEAWWDAAQATRIYVVDADKAWYSDDIGINWTEYGNAHGLIASCADGDLLRGIVIGTWDADEPGPGAAEVWMTTGGAWSEKTGDLLSVAGGEIAVIHTIKMLW